MQPLCVLTWGRAFKMCFKYGELKSDFYDTTITIFTSQESNKIWRKTNPEVHIQKYCATILCVEGA